MAKKPWTPPSKLPCSTLIPINELDKTGTQVRVSHNEETIASYTEVLNETKFLQPIEVIWDGERPILMDGFHRTEATLRAGFDSIQANIREGTRRDAILGAVEFNKSHGLRLTNADRKKIINIFLDDPEWSQWNDSEIARRVGCHASSVMRHRKELSSAMQKIDSSKKDGASSAMQKIDFPKKVSRNGKTFEMNTKNIGKKPEKSAPSTPSQVTEVQEDTEEIEVPPDQESHFDYVGHEIPAHLEESFGMRDRYHSILDCISEIKSECKKMAELPGGEILSGRYSQILAQSNELYQAVKGAEPYSLCLKCKGNMKKATTSCQACKGNGYVTRQGFDRFPAADRSGVPKPPKKDLVGAK